MIVSARTVWDWEKSRLPDRYRLMCFGRGVAPWRETLGEVQDDAVDLGYGTRYGVNNDAFYLDASCVIWHVKACAATEKNLRPRRPQPQRLKEVADLKRRRRAA